MRCFPQPRPDVWLASWKSTILPFPARMSEREQQYVGSPMHREIVQDGIDPLHLGPDSGVYLLKERVPICQGSTRKRCSERLPGGWTKRSVDVAFLSAAIINFLFRPFCWLLTGGASFDHPFPWMALGRFWPHFIETDHNASLGRLGVEGRDGPLFSAKSGSTRSPNQHSSLRQRRPSACSSSPRRLRLISTPFASLR